MKLTEQRRAMLEFLAVAGGFAHITEVADLCATWAAAMQQIESLRACGLIDGLADHIHLTNAGREAIDLPPRVLPLGAEAVPA